LEEKKMMDEEEGWFQRAPGLKYIVTPDFKDKTRYTLYVK
jgi:hypothetical protein